MVSKADMLIHRAMLNEGDFQRMADLHCGGFAAQGWSADDFAQICSNDHMISYYVTIKEQDAGFVLFSVLPPIAEIVTLSVMPSYQRMGVGTTLMDYALADLSVLDVSEIMLEVAVDNEGARRFYEVMAFVEFNRRKGYYDRGDMGRVDAICMRKRVDKKAA